MQHWEKLLFKSVNCQWSESAMLQVATFEINWPGTQNKKMHVIRILWVSKWAGRRDGYGWLNALSMFLTHRVCLVIFLMQFVGVWKSSCLYTTTPYDHCGVVLSLLHFPKVLWCSEMVSTEVSRHFLASEACSEVPTLIQGFPRRIPKIEDQRVLRVRICVVCDSFHPTPSVYPR